VALWTLTIVSKELKQKVEKLAAELGSLDDPAKSIRPTVVVTRMVGPQASEAKWDNVVVRSDESQTVGGTGSGPSPTALFVASVGFGDNVLFARQAAANDVDFDSFESKVEARWDRKGLFEMDGTDASVQSILIETRISTNASPQKIVELLKLTHRRSPMITTLAKCIPIKRKLLVNEVEIAL
jgi:putative redox protein